MCLNVIQELDFRPLFILYLNFQIACKIKLLPTDLLITKKEIVTDSPQTSCASLQYSWKWSIHVSS